MKTNSTRYSARRRPAKRQEPQDYAVAAGLRYVTDDRPGIRRLRTAKGFRYVGIDGKPLHDPSVLHRIKSLRIPPAYRDVWICPYANGHLQATARDARGRKQYRYHLSWRGIRDESKFDKVGEFGRALPTIREATARDLALPGLPRQKLLAAVVSLLETTLIRVGNDEYARTNNSFGLTTMLNDHVNVTGPSITFQFRGKSGKDHFIEIKDRRLAKIIDKCQELPGQTLFEYVAENGDIRSIDSSDVNEYLREISGQPFTAKDFRTWAGTVLAAAILSEMSDFETEAEAKRNVVRALERVASSLGNTPAICRKCYVHPHVIEAYLAGDIQRTLAEYEPDTWPRAVK